MVQLSIRRSVLGASPLSHLDTGSVLSLKKREGDKLEIGNATSSAIVNRAKANCRLATTSRATTREILDQSNVEVAPTVRNTTSDHFRGGVDTETEGRDILGGKRDGQAEEARNEQGDCEQDLHDVEGLCGCNSWVRLEKVMVAE